MKIYKLYAGMTGEFEILETNAEKNTVIDYIISCSNCTLPENDPELFFTEKGFLIRFICCQYDDSENIKIDFSIDTYDYI